MTEEPIEAKTPVHLWIIGVVSLFWNAFGGFDYFMTQSKNAAYMGQFTTEQLEYFYALPAWANFFWALGVWGSVLGSVLLLLRNKFAVTAFAVSLVGLLGSTYYQMMADMPDSLRSTGMIIFSVIIWAVVIMLFLYSRKMQSSGVLR